LDENTVFAEAMGVSPAIHENDFILHFQDRYWAANGGREWAVKAISSMAAFDTPEAAAWQLHLHMVVRPRRVASACPVAVVIFRSDDSAQLPKKKQKNSSLVPEPSAGIQFCRWWNDCSAVLAKAADD